MYASLTRLTRSSSVQQLLFHGNLEDDNLEDDNLKDNKLEDNKLVDDRLDERLQNKNTTISQIFMPL